MRLEQVTDGTSHTALFSEAVLGDGDDNHIETPGDWFRIDTTNTTSAQVYAACTSLTPETGDSNQFSRSGRNWVNGNYIVTRYNHIMTPNLRSCARCAPSTGDLGTAANNQGGATTASSRHPGGVNLVMADASTAVRQQRRCSECLVGAGQPRRRRNSHLAVVNKKEI